MERNRIVVAMGSRFALAITLATVASFIVACGSSYPSESTARTVLENMGKNDRFTVRTFTKTNGKGDDKRYIVEYDAELECGRDTRGAVMSGYAFGCVKQPGRMIEESGTIPFEKTEKGWRGPDGNVY